MRNRSSLFVNITSGELGFGKIWASENMNGGIKMQQEKSTISELIMEIYFLFI